MKLVIQVPCLNEEKTLPTLLSEIPKKINGIDHIELVIINDGSTDDTVSVAINNGASHIINHKKNIGLGQCFQSGLNYAKKNNFDLLINTDADNQYKSFYIEKLVENLIKNESDIVIGYRDFNNISHFSFTKKILQKIGSKVVSIIAGYKIFDASSGFRAYSKKAIESLSIDSNFSYTLETLIQAGDKKLKVSQIPIQINPPTRKSRLFKSNYQFIMQQLKIIIKSFLIYKPLLFFSSIAAPLFMFGIILLLRFLFKYFIGEGGGNVQSLIIGSMSIMIGVNIFCIGIIGELVKNNRKFIEKIFFKNKYDK